MDIHQHLTGGLGELPLVLIWWLGQGPRNWGPSWLISPPPLRFLRYLHAQRWAANGKLKYSSDKREGKSAFCPQKGLSAQKGRTAVLITWTESVPEDVLQSKTLETLWLSWPLQAPNKLTDISETLLDTDRTTFQGFLPKRKHFKLRSIKKTYVLNHFKIIQLFNPVWMTSG